MNIPPLDANEHGNITFSNVALPLCHSLRSLDRLGKDRLSTPSTAQANFGLENCEKAHNPNTYESPASTSLTSMSRPAARNIFK